MNEKELVQRYKEAKENAETAEEASKAANAAMKKAALDIITYLEMQGAQSSAKYEGIGRVLMVKPRLLVNVTNGNKDKLFDHLRSIGRDDLIKETVHPQTLRAFVSECLDNGTRIPTEIINYTLEAQIRFEKPKEI